MLSSSVPRGLPPSTRLRGVWRNTATSRCYFSVSGSHATRASASNKNQHQKAWSKAKATMANSSSPSLSDVDVAIVGGGPAGLSAALAIERAAPGTRVAVFERARSLKPVGFTIGLMGEEHSRTFPTTSHFSPSSPPVSFFDTNPDLSSSNPLSLTPTPRLHNPPSPPPSPQETASPPSRPSTPTSEPPSSPASSRNPFTCAAVVCNGRHPARGHLADRICRRSGPRSDA